MSRTPRDEVYAAIDGERAYQDNLWTIEEDGQDVPNPLTIGEFVLLLEEYAAQARKLWAGEKKPEGKTLDVMRKCAAIAVHCMEQHGAPPRAATDLLDATRELQDGTYQTHTSRH